MEYLLGYIAFITAFMAVGCIVLYALEKLIIFSFDNNDKLLFEGRTHYVYINTSDGWKINSLEPKDRSTDVPCVLK